MMPDRDATASVRRPCISGRATLTEARATIASDKPAIDTARVMPNAARHLGQPDA